MTLHCTMMLGDCIEVMPTLPASSAHLVFADLPYGSTDYHWDMPLDLQSTVSRFVDILSSRSGWITTSNETFYWKMHRAWEKHHRYSLIWDKGRGANFFSAKHRPLSSFEFIGVWGPMRTYNPQMRNGFRALGKTFGEVKTQFIGAKGRGFAPGTRRPSGTQRFPLSVLAFAKDSVHRRRGKNAHREKAHGSQKPVALLDWLIRTYSKLGEHVLDPVSGSATTACAALLAGRSVTCIEKDAGYFEAGLERVERLIADQGLSVCLDVVR